MSTINVNDLINQIITAAKPQVQEILKESQPILQGQTADWLGGLYVLSTSNPDAAQLQVLAAMDESAQVHEVVAAGEQADADAAKNAQAAAERAKWIAEAWPELQAILGILAGAAAVLL